MIRESVRVVYEVQVQDEDLSLARMLRAVAKYDCCVLDGIGSTFHVRINLSHVPGFERYVGPVSMRYRSPVRFIYGRLVPIYEGPEEEVLSNESDAGSN